jgi:hypothetical protein
MPVEINRSVYLLGCRQRFAVAARFEAHQKQQAPVSSSARYQLAEALVGFHQDRPSAVLSTDLQAACVVGPHRAGQLTQAPVCLLDL